MANTEEIREIKPTRTMISRTLLDKNLRQNGFTEQVINQPHNNPDIKFYTSMDIQAKEELGAEITQFTTDLKLLIDTIGGIYEHLKLDPTEITPPMTVKTLILRMESKTTHQAVRPERIKEIQKLLMQASDQMVYITIGDNEGFYNEPLISLAVIEIEGFQYVQFRRMPPTFKYGKEIQHITSYDIRETNLTKILTTSGDLKNSGLKNTPLNNALNLYFLERVFPMLTAKNKQTYIPINYKTIIEFLKADYEGKSIPRRSRIHTAIHKILNKYKEQGKIKDFDSKISGIENGKTTPYHQIKIYKNISD